MRRGPSPSRLRTVFTLFMAVFLLLGMTSPLTVAENATPEAPSVPVEEAPVEPVDPPASDPVEPAPEAPVTDEGGEPAPSDQPETDVVAPAETTDESVDAGVESADAQILAETQTIYADTLEPTTCSTSNNYRLLVIQPNPGADVQSVSVTFANGNTVEANRVVSANDRAAFRAYGNLDTTVVQATAVVPADFTATSFRVGSGPCNLPTFNVTVAGVTSDSGSAANASVSVTNAVGAVVASGVLDANNAFNAGALPNGAYSVSIDATDEGYGTGTADFTVAGAPITVDVDLVAVPPMLETIEAEIGLQCSPTSDTYGVQLRRAMGPETVTFHFTDGTSAIGTPRGFGDNPPTVTTYNTGPVPGKTLARVTAEVDTVAWPNYTFRTTVGQCPSEYTITGTVTNAVTNAPIVGATVTISGTELSAVTGEGGTYSIAAVPVGTYDFVFTAGGYESQTVSARMGWSGDRVVNAELDPSPTAGNVTINISSNNPDRGNAMPAGSTWTVTSVDNAELTMSGTFAEEHLQLPAEIVVEGLVSFGSYEVTVNAAPAFVVFNDVFTVDDVDEEIHVSLTPDVSPGRLTISFEDGRTDPVGCSYDIYDENDERVTGAPTMLSLSRIIGFMFDGGAEYRAVVDCTELGYEVVEQTLTAPGGGEWIEFNLVIPAPEKLPTATISVVMADGSTVEGLGLSWAIDDASIGGAEGRVDAGSDVYDIPVTLWEGELAPGTYWMTISAGDDYQLIQEQFTVTAEGENTFVFELEATSTPTGTISGVVTDVATGDPIEGAWVAFYAVADEGDMSLMAIAPSTETDENGAYSMEVPYGTYDVYFSANGYYGDYERVTVDAEGAVVNKALEPLPAYGWLDVYKFYCEDATDVSFNAGVDVSDCDTGAARFTVYMYGDGTADYDELFVWESGYGYLQLEAGTYDLVEEGTDAKFTFKINQGEITEVEVVNPGEAPAPRDGTVNVSTFLCTNIAETRFTSDYLTVMRASGLPTFEPACDPVATDVTFYLVGDGTDDHWQLTTKKNGAGSIELAPGTYEVVVEATQARTFIDVPSGDFVSLDIQIPAGGEVVPGSSVNISKFYCDTLTEVEWLASSSDSEYSDRAQLPDAPDCRPGIATFTFYLYGDGTADYAQIKVYGAGSIGLEPGRYLVVEEETQATFDLEVLEGGNTQLRVNNPMPEKPAPTPVPDKPQPVKPDHGKKDEKKADTKVTKLPETGAGSSESTDALAMAVAAAAMAAGAGALRLRKDT